MDIIMRDFEKIESSMLQIFISIHYLFFVCLFLWHLKKRERKFKLNHQRHQHDVWLLLHWTHKVAVCFNYSFAWYATNKTLEC